MRSIQLILFFSFIVLLSCNKTESKGKKVTDYSGTFKVTSCTKNKKEISNPDSEELGFIHVSNTDNGVKVLTEGLVNKRTPLNEVSLAENTEFPNQFNYSDVYADYGALIEKDSIQVAVRIKYSGTRTGIYIMDGVRTNK